MTVTTDKKIDIPDEPTTPLLPVACPKEGDRPARALKIAGAATAAVTIGEEAAGSSCKCRVCLEDTTTLGNPLISPCSCTGRTGLVHRRCLLQWRATKAGSPAYFRCDICHYKYHFRRLWWGAVLRDRMTVALVFLLLVLSASALLGYWPVLQAIGGIPPSPDFNPILHFANGVIIFGLLGCVGMLVTVCCGCTVPEPAAGHPDPCGSCGSCKPDPCESCETCKPDCSGCSSAEGACLLCVFYTVVIGVLMAAFAAYVRWYTWVSWLLHTVEVMVENVGPVARRRAVARAARKGSKEAGGSAKAGAVVAERADAGAGAGGDAGAGGAEVGVTTQAPTAACMV